MDGSTLMQAMSYSGYPAPMSLAEYETLAVECNKALVQAGCTNRFRAAGYLSQIGAESGSLRWNEELADGSAYNWRNDLGNNQPGDGPRFKGRSFIQVTGRTNYAAFGRWAVGRGLVSDPNYFIQHPTELAQPQWAFLGATWYWVGSHPHDGYKTLNQAADLAAKGQVTWANAVMTHMVNGGENNIGGRLARFQKCLTLGNRIMPTIEHLSTAGGAVRFIKVRETGRYYMWGPGQYLIMVSPAGAKVYAAIWDTPIKVVTKQQAKAIDANCQRALKPHAAVI